jgi:hypothetical protein
MEKNNQPSPVGTYTRPLLPGEVPFEKPKNIIVVTLPEHFFQKEVPAMEFKK